MKGRLINIGCASLTVTALAMFSTTAGALSFNFKTPTAVPESKDLCWKFRELPGFNTDPYPTDIVRVYDGLYRPSQYAEWEVMLKKPLAGEWVQGVDGDPVTVPMVGTMVPVSVEGNEYVQMQLAGNVTDLTFNDPFTYECTINTKLDPNTGTSTLDFDPDRPTGRLGYVYAYCTGYFGAVEGPYTPYATPGLGLQRIDCPEDSD